MSQVTTHVLDTALGVPAEGVGVALDALTDGGWASVDTGVTNADGRITDIGPDALAPGRYRLVFDTEGYLRASGQEVFFPEAVIVFLVDAPRHLHVPLLLSPFAQSTYRGS